MKGEDRGPPRGQTTRAQRGVQLSRCAASCPRWPGGRPVGRRGQLFTLAAVQVACGTPAEPTCPPGKPGLPVEAADKTA